MARSKHSVLLRFLCRVAAKDGLQNLGIQRGPRG